MAKAQKKEEPETEEKPSKKAKETKEVAKVESAVPAYFSQSLQVEDDGLDEIEAGDIRIPFFKVLQSNSAQLKKQEAEFIKGAEQGDFCLHDSHWSGEEGIFLVPVKCRMKYIEWQPKEGGGAKFIAAHTAAVMGDAIRSDDPKKKGWFLKNGNEIVKTADWFVIVYDKAKKQLHQGVMSLKKTGLSAHSDMSTVLKTKRTESGAPAYVNLFRATSIYESNEDNSWYTIKLRRLGFHHECAGLGESGKEFENYCLTEEEAELLATTGAAMLKAVSEGRVKAEEEAEKQEGPASSQGGKVAEETEDEIPF